MQNVVFSIIDIIERLKQVRGHTKDADLARDFGIPPKKLGVWKTRNTIPLEELTTFCGRFGYYLEWALTGEGEIEKIRPLLGGEPVTPYNGKIERAPESKPVDRETRIINQLLEGMTDDQKADVRKYTQEKKQLSELITERNKWIKKG